MTGKTADLCRRVRHSGAACLWGGPPRLGALLVAGPDAAKFLHTQLTCDVLGLGPGESRPAAALTRTGAVQVLFHLCRLPARGQPFPSFLAVLEVTQIERLQAHLARFVVASAVDLEDVSGEFSGLTANGPRARLDALVARLPEEALRMDLPLTGDPGLLALLPSGRHTDLQEAAQSCGMAFLADDSDGRQAWDWLRLESGWPLAGPDFEPGATILPATGMEQQTVSWTKGCYPGQEVVARIRTYGSVPRRLTGLVIQEPLLLDPGQLPQPGSPLRTGEGRSIGTWASSGYSVAWDRPVAMVYLGRDHRAPGTRLQLEAGAKEIEAEVVALPFYTGASTGERAAQCYRQAVRMFGAGRDEQAAALLQEAVALDGTLTAAWEALGVVLGRSGRYHEAIDIFRRLEERAPDEPMVNTNLSLFFMKLGDKEEAERQKDLATLKKFGGGMTQEEIAAREQAARRERREDAGRRRAMFAEVLAVDPRDGLALMGMGKALGDMEEWAEAEDVLARACAVMGDNSPLYAARGRALENLGRPEEAAAVYREGLDVAARKGDLMPQQEMQHRLFMLEGKAG